MKSENCNNISINKNPMASKSFMMILDDMAGEDVDFGKVINMCLSELVSGCKFNILDMPFYLAAINLLKNSLETTIDESDKAVYNDLVDSCNLTTIHIDKNNFKDTNKEDED